MNLSEQQVDAFREFLNIGVGRAAATLNEMVDAHIGLTVPVIKVVSSDAIEAHLSAFGDQINSAIGLTFTGPFSGSAALLFSLDNAAKVLAAVTGEPPDDSQIDDVSRGTLLEVGNIVINGIVGSISNLIEGHMTYSVPSYSEDTVRNLVMSGTEGQGVDVLLARSSFCVEDLQMHGDIIMVFEVGSFGLLLHAIDSVTGA